MEQSTSPTTLFTEDYNEGMAYLNSLSPILSETASLNLENIESILRISERTLFRLKNVLNYEHIAEDDKNEIRRMISIVKEHIANLKYIKIYVPYIENQKYAVERIRNDPNSFETYGASNAQRMKKEARDEIKAAEISIMKYENDIKMRTQNFSEINEEMKKIGLFLRNHERKGGKYVKTKKSKKSKKNRKGKKSRKSRKSRKNRKNKKIYRK